jgi:hypothetical protein
MDACQTAARMLCAATDCRTMCTVVDGGDAQPRHAAAPSSSAEYSATRDRSSREGSKRRSAATGQHGVSPDPHSSELPAPAVTDAEGHHTVPHPSLSPPEQRCLSRRAAHDDTGMAAPEPRASKCTRMPMNL